MHCDLKRTIIGDHLTNLHDCCAIAQRSPRLLIGLRRAASLHRACDVTVTEEACESQSMEQPAVRQSFGLTDRKY